MLKTVFQLLIKTIIITFFTFLLLEGGVRLILYYSLNTYLTKTLPQPYGNVIKNTLAFHFHSVGRVTKFDPICYFIYARGFFRAPNGRTDCPKEKGGDEIRIICIGDSTTYGFAVDYGHCWVRLLGESLAEKYPEKNIRVLNAGLPAASSKQVKRIFQVYLASYHPDILIWRGGYRLTDTYAIDNRVSDSIKFYIWRCLYESHIFRVICVLLDKGEDMRTANRVCGYLTNRMAPNRHPFEGFDSDFDIVKKIAREHGTRYVLQVDYLRRDRKGVIHSDLEDRKRSDRDPAVDTLAAFKEHDTKTLPDNLFVDEMHLTKMGEALTAEEISKFIINRKWIESFRFSNAKK